jgi:SAM-dependent methyltransferase
MPEIDDRALLDEQIAYYRARAAEYDRTSSVEGDPFAPHSERIRAALRALGPFGRVLEVAAGTGQWTPELAGLADELVVTDASPEMLALNAARVGTQHSVEYRVIDAFTIPPTGDFDLVFFGHFHSHVPRSRLPVFWDVVAGLLAADGRVFFVDEARHGLWNEEWIDAEADVVRRTLLDGTQHRAVKVLWEPAELEGRLRQLGWQVDVTRSGPFLWGTGQRGSG